MNLRPLSDRQLEVLSTIRKLTQQRGFAPSLRELGRALGITSTNGVNDAVKALERRELVVRDWHTARSMRLTVKGLAIVGEGA